MFHEKLAVERVRDTFQIVARNEQSSFHRGYSSGLRSGLRIGSVEVIAIHLYSYN